MKYRELTRRVQFVPVGDPNPGIQEQLYDVAGSRGPVHSVLLPHWS